MQDQAGSSEEMEEYPNDNGIGQLNEYQDVELPELTNDEYEAISSLKDIYPKASFRDLRSKIIATIPRLGIHSEKMIGLMYYRKRGIFWKTPCDLFEFFKRQKTQQLLIKMALKPAEFLMNNSYPFFESRKGVKWTYEEEELLILIMNQNSNGLTFAFLSLCFPGRTGKQVHKHFMLLVKAGRINDPRSKETKKRHQFNPICKRYFLPNAEKDLKDEIIELTTKGVHVTEEMVKEKAMVYYKTPWILAERAAYQEFERNGLMIYEGDSERYTDEFIQLTEEIRSKFNIDIAIDEDEEEDYHETVIKEILTKYKLLQPKFTHTWFKKFLKRNRLSLRLAHYIRRGAIDMKYVKKFIKKLAKYILEHGWECVYNMDETACRINNGSRKAVAPIALEVIEVDAKRNEKECFTVVATCTKNSTLPLIILKRGMSTKVKSVSSKIRSGNKAEIWPTMNKQGWMNL